MRWMLGLAMALATSASAGTVGQWFGSGVDTMGNLLTWNSSLTGYTYSMQKVRATVEGAGNTVAPDSELTAANLAGWDSLVVRMPQRAPTAGEMADLSAWVQGGGLLMLMVDMNMMAGDGPSKALLAGIGSNIVVQGNTVDQVFAFNSGLFLTDGPPYSIANYFLSPSPGRWLSGGASLSHGGTSGWTDAQRAQSEAEVRYQQLGAGYVVVFADTIDVDYFSPTANTLLGKFFLNAAAYSNPHLDLNPDPDPTPTGEVPEPGTWALVLAGGAGLMVVRRRSGPRAGGRLREEATHDVDHSPAG